MYLDTDGDIESIEEEQVQWYRFDQDGPDGRDGWGGGRKIHKIKSAHTTEEDIDKRVLNGSVMLNLIYVLDDNLMNILREKEEKTQKEVADLLGISQSYISRLEKKIIHRLKREIIKME